MYVLLEIELEYIKDKKRDLLTEKYAIRTRWKEHFEEL